MFSFFYLLVLFPFNFIDAEERNATFNKRINKNGILIIFIFIHKLTVFCLRLSFHLTFKFLVLQIDRQCKTTIQSGRSYADFSTKS